MAESKAEQDLRKDLDAIKSDIDALRKDLVGVVDTVKGTATKRADAEIDALRKRLDKLATNVQTTGREQLRAIEEQIEERPLVSLAMAFAIGLMLGRLFDRR
jgi:ElaB/YqjD/DUF883 family membrane-anchored ribosome-binding protein